MAKSKSENVPVVKSTAMHKDEALEQAVEQIADAVDTLAKDMTQIKRKVSSIAVVAERTPARAELPLYNIDGDHYRFKYPKVDMKGKVITAEMLAEDEALLQSLFAERPYLFIKI